MRYRVETSVLVRLSNRSDKAYAVADQAVVALKRQGASLFITPQNLIEYRSVATRPIDANGLGLLPDVADAEATGFEGQFILLPDTGTIYPAWKRLVQTLSVIGKQVHDARLVAVCEVYGVNHILTFNTVHFARLAAASGGPILVIDPASVQDVAQAYTSFPNVPSA